MAAVMIELDDLTPFAPNINPDRAEAMIADAIALAARAAPCILEDDFEHAAAAKAILRGAILRWDSAGAGVVTQQSAGGFQQTIDTRTTRRAMFWPSEISDLRALCAGNGGNGAYTVQLSGDDEDAAAPIWWNP